ncbi:MAG: HPr family phosphocarrier protein [Candidatus Hydrogenedentota bacterium]
MPDLTEKMTIVNSMGLHARPAAKLVQTVLQYASDVQVNVNGQKVNAKSIMGLLTLAAAQGTDMTVMAQGPDAEEAVNAVRELVASGFGED